VRVTGDAAAHVELVGANADVIDTDDVGHFLKPVDVFLQARKQMPDANPTCRSRRSPGRDRR